MGVERVSFWEHLIERTLYLRVYLIVGATGYKFDGAEEAYYTRIFRSLQEGGVVTGLVAAPLMRKSCLSDDMLGKVSSTLFFRSHSQIKHCG